MKYPINFILNLHSNNQVVLNFAQPYSLKVLIKLFYIKQTENIYLIFKEFIMTNEKISSNSAIDNIKNHMTYGKLLFDDCFNKVIKMLKLRFEFK